MPLHTLTRHLALLMHHASTICLDVVRDAGPFRRRARRRFPTLRDAIQLGAVLLVGLISCPVNADDNDAGDFATTVAPILVDRCLACHGDDSLEGGYDISTLAGIFRAGDSTAEPIVAADPEASELFRRLVSDDPDELMPSGGPPLEEDEIAAIRRWIVGGGEIKGLDPDRPLVDSLRPHEHRLPPQVYPRPLPVTALAAAQRSSPLVVAGYRELLVWPAPQTSEPHRWPGFDVHLSAIAISPDGIWLAVAHGTPGQRGEVTLGQLTDDGLRARRTVVRTSDVPTAIEFSPAGDLLAITTLGGELTVVTVPAAQATPAKDDPVRLSLVPHADAIAAVAWSTDGKHLLSASRDRTARVIALADGRSISVYARHDRAVHGICQIEAGTVTIDETGTLRLWSGTNRNPILSRQRVSDAPLGLCQHNGTVLVPSTDRVRRLRVERVERPDGTDDSGKPKTRRVQQWKELPPLEVDAAEAFISIAVSPDGDVWVGTHSGRVYRWADGAAAEQPPNPSSLMALPR